MEHLVDRLALRLAILGGAGAAAGVGMALWSQLHRTDAEDLYRRYQRTTFREGAEMHVAEDEDDDD